MGEERPVVDPPRQAARRPYETPLRLFAAVAALYVFLVGVKALETGISALGSNFVDRVFDSVANPIAGLAAGVLATVLVQSSSVTTATIVGLVGAGVLPVETAVPMVMGANIGTTVTNTLASLGHLRQAAYLRRAFAAATVHDYFNLLTVAVLLPLQISFDLIGRLARWVAGGVDGVLPVATGDSPIKEAIKAPISVLTGLIEAAGWVAVKGPLLLGAGLALIFFGLWAVTRQMKKIMSGRMESAFNTILGRGGGLPAMVVGLVLTVAVQSSSITTSLLIPLVAAGVLTLANAFPVTLGANLGTTVTAVLASVAADSPEALVIAMAHVIFNVLGILIFYPIPAMRRIPIALATRTADLAVANRTILAVYVIGLFIALPLALLLIW